MRTRILLLCVMASAMLISATGQTQDRIPIRLSTPVHSAEVTDLEGGAYQVRTTGNDPYVLAEELARSFDPERIQVFAFEYQCPTGLDFFQIYFVAPKSGWVHSGSIKIEPTTDWTPFAANLKAQRPDDWDGAIRQFRIDFGDAVGKTVMIRNIQLRPMTPEEVRMEEQRLAEERRHLSQLQTQVDKTLIAPARIGDITDTIAASHRFSNDGNVTSIAVIGRELDLATQLREYADEVGPAVPLPPPMVAGEGYSSKNHTVIRILNRYGICEVQFLAYAPSVMGGVRVATGIGPDGRAFIIAAPLSDRSIRELRVFDRHGNWLSSFDVSRELTPPFWIAVGDFIPDRPGDEIALSSGSIADRSFRVLVYSGSGRLLRTLDIPLPALTVGSLVLSTLRRDGGDQIIAHPAGRPEFYVLNAATETVQTHAAGLGAHTGGVYQSAFVDTPYVTAVDEPLFSTLERIPPAGSPERVNVGERENLFWFTIAGAYKDVPEGEYTRHSLFGHIRTDFGSPHARHPDFARTDADYWAGEAYQQQVDGRLANYDTDPPVCWEPCFTHRWFAGQAGEWADARDEETGLPMYTLVSRENETTYYGEFGATKAFVSGSYAPGLTAVECMYVYPQRAFLRGLAQRFRRNPEHFVAVEPNHEMEINAESVTTHGDYNPSMIRAFYRHLVSLYGGLENINRVFGTDFSEDRFDAPRDLQRGGWDAYSTDNPYYLAWMRFMNHAIYRVIAGTYREALLAGFPPEAVKCHQIPDHYAVASLTAFSKPARRITPIDWNLNAGVGYGFTRYGVWFEREHNCLQGAHSSGFDGCVIGEYQSLTPDADAAYEQLAYLRDHGTQFIHCMNWPKGHDKGYNDALAVALRRLVEENAPRPGITGGTGQVRAVGAGEDAYEIVSIGTGRRNTGLLKSINADGSWEGSVYVTPFHAHIAIEPLLQRADAELAEQPISVGPLQDISAGNLIEVCFGARADEGGHLALRLYHEGIELAGARTVMPIGADWRRYRCLVRVQIDLDDLRIEIGASDAEGAGGTGRGVMLRDLAIIRHTERTTRLKRGALSGERHEGGVTFDIIEGGDWNPRASARGKRRSPLRG